MPYLNLNELSLHIATLHAQRRRLARQAMTAQAAMVFDMVPALLHCHDPALPGGEADAPHGIKGVEDMPLRRRLAEQLGVSAASPAPTDILAVYSMGSTGTLGQTRSSDLDIWVCHRSDLTQPQRLALKAKCDRLTQWAQGQGMDLTFFLIDPEEFRQGNKQSMTCESCGSFQHWLLLDEFYRSAICLAGQLPIWLLISPAERRPYLQAKAQLFANGIDPEQWIDLGAPDPIPADEFLGSMLWLLYKGIDRPYKALLKLTLMSVYARQYPKVRLLSTVFREALHRGETDLMALDPYLLLERYLSAQGLAPGDRDLMRSCLYLKCGGDRPADVSATHAETLAQLTRTWGWDSQRCQQLQSHRDWPLEALQAWHQRLREQMLAGLHEARELFRRTANDSRLCPIELTVLSRKLDAAFADKPGKLEVLRLPPGVDVSQSTLLLTRRQQWQLCSADGQRVLYSRPDLPGLLGWCLLNGFLTGHTELQLPGKELALDSVDSLCRSMAWLANKPDPQDQILAQPAQLEKAQLIVNLEQDATAGLKLRKGDNDADMLQFGDRRLNLVSELTLLLRNTWGETMVSHFSGPQALAKLLLHLVPQLPRDNSLSQRLYIHCFASQLGEPLARQLLALLLTARQKLAEGPWTLCAGQAKWVFWWQSGSLHWQELHDPLAFYAQLSAAKLAQQHPATDSHVPPPVYSNGLCGLVQLFFLSDSDGYQLFVSNEQNQVSYYHYPAMDKASLVSLISRFYAQKTQTSGDSVFNLPQYYELMDNNGQWQLTPLTAELLETEH